MNYKFRLERVLKVRSIREDRAQNQLLQARQQKREVESKLTELNSAREQLYNYLRQKQDTSIRDRQLTREYLSRQKQQIEKIKGELAAKIEEVDNCQQEFIDKRKQRQVLDKLKEKDYEEFNKELLHKQQKQLDEIGQRINFYQG